MIIAKTPFRISFFGGGTDIPEYFRSHGGAVISSTFDKYCYVNVRHLPRFFDYRNQVSYSRIERVNRREDIQHPAVREAMKFLDMDELIISYDADLPARTGLGTSSSFMVGMLQAFHVMKGRYISKQRLADEAIHVERDLCREDGGWQDQIAVAFGGLNRIDFSGNGYAVRPLIMDNERKRRLNQNLLLFYTGISRNSSDIQAETQRHMGKNLACLRDMLDLVDEAERILADKTAELDDFGRLLDTTWQLKRQLSEKVSSANIDELYRKAIKAGALGGKLLGAGGGGFLLVYVPPESKSAVRKSLKELLEVPFQFENHGTEIIYYDPEDSSSDEAATVGGN